MSDKPTDAMIRAGGEVISDKITDLADGYASPDCVAAAVWEAMEKTRLSPPDITPNIPGFGWSVNIPGGQQYSIEISDILRTAYRWK